MTNLGRMLKLYCRVKNIDVRTLAIQLDMSAATANRIQNGRDVSQENMIKLLNWLFIDFKKDKATESQSASEAGEEK